MTAVPGTKLLTCQGNTITDASSSAYNEQPHSAHTITVNGDTKASEISSFDFDGTDDQINCGSSDDFAFGTGDFTIEFWCNPDTVGTEGIISISTNGGISTTNWQFRFNSSKVKWNYSQTSNIISNSTVSAGEWTHVVATRSGTCTNFIHQCSF